MKEAKGLKILAVLENGEEREVALTMDQQERFNDMFRKGDALMVDPEPGPVVVSEQQYGNYKIVIYECEEKEPEFETGKWYAINNTHVVMNTGRETSIGFFGGKWTEKTFMATPDLWQPADMNEVSRLMIAEAEKRGYKKGSKIMLPWVKNSTETIILGGESGMCDNGYLYYEGHCVWTPEKGWAEIVKDKTPAIEEAIRRYPVGTRVLISGISYDINGRPWNWSDENRFYKAAAYAVGFEKTLPYPVIVWSHTTGWAEIIEPNYTNEYGNFYIGDKAFTVNKANYKISEGEYTNEGFSGVRFEMFKSHAQAEQYVKEHRVFENGEHYKCVYEEENNVAKYKDETFYIIGDDCFMDRAEFDSIGEKITF